MSYAWRYLDNCWGRWVLIDMGWMFFFGLEIWETSRCSSTFAVLPKPKTTSEEGLVPLSPQHPEELVEQVPFGLRRLG
jgi:hypothetical protein